MPDWTSWQHGWVSADAADTPLPERGIVHTHELIVDIDDWPAVHHVLGELGVGYDGFDNKFGLARIRLNEPYDTVAYEQGLLTRINERLGREPRLGRNRLVARARLEFDSDDVDAAPKVVPSSVGDAEPAADPGLHRGGTDVVAPVRVGVVDTAFVRHPYLDGACLYRQVPIAQVQAGEDPGHASFVTGLILQLAPHAIVMTEGAIKAEGVADMVTVHDAICRLTLAGAHLINLSLGCVTADDEEPFVLSHALDWATRAAQRTDRPAPVFVAACGNTGDEKPFWPAADNRVCAVAAATERGGKWSISDYSGRGAWVDVAARGDALLSTLPNVTAEPVDYGAYAYWSGTSFATAVITGLKAAQLADAWTADLDGKPAGEVTFDLPDAPAGKTVPVYDPEQIRHK